MADNDYIYKRDLPLHIDVHCHECQRLVALSNCTQRDGRTYCGRCEGHTQGVVAAFVSDFNSAIIEID